MLPVMDQAGFEAMVGCVALCHGGKLNVFFKKNNRLFSRIGLRRRLAWQNVALRGGSTQGRSSPRPSKNPHASSRRIQGRQGNAPFGKRSRHGFRQSSRQVSREFAGRRAGVGYSAVEIGIERGRSGRRVSPIGQRSRRRIPPTWRSRKRSCGTFPARGYRSGRASRLRHTATMPSAMSCALVGLPS